MELKALGQSKLIARLLPSEQVAPNQGRTSSQTNPENNQNPNSLNSINSSNSTGSSFKQASDAVILTPFTASQAGNKIKQESREPSTDTYEPPDLPIPTKDEQLIEKMLTLVLPDRFTEFGPVQSKIPDGELLKATIVKVRNSRGINEELPQVINEKLSNFDEDLNSVKKENELASTTSRESLRNLAVAIEESEIKTIGERSSKTLTNTQKLYSTDNQSFEPTFLKKV
jgi:hypothetical protein